MFAENNCTIVEPDISVICDPGNLTERSCIRAPDWIIEIVSPGNPSHDYVRKLNLYLDAKVKEYWIIDPDRETIFTYRLDADRFDVSSFSFRDSLKSGLYEDLRINFKALK